MQMALFLFTHISVLPWNVNGCFHVERGWFNQVGGRTKIMIRLHNTVKKEHGKNMASRSLRHLNINDDFTLLAVSDSNGLHSSLK